MSDPFYFKFYGRDFRDGVRGLKPDVVGIYILVLTLIYDEGGAVPDDAAWIAPRIGFDKRVWKRCRDELVSAGKLRAANGRLTNKKADCVIADRDRISGARSDAGKAGGESSGRARRERNEVTSGELLSNLSRTSRRSLKEVSENGHAKSLKTRQNTEASASSYSLELDNATLLRARDARAMQNDLQNVLDAQFEEGPPWPRSEPTAARPPDQAPTKLDHDLTERELLEACCAAAGPGLTTNRKILEGSAGRIALAIRSGCSLHADIVPVITARTAKARASPIETFGYFELAWLEHRDKRLSPPRLAPRVSSPTSAGTEDAFEEAWRAWPRAGSSRTQALKAWRSHDANGADKLAAVRAFLATPQAKAGDGGKFTPYLQRWLRDSLASFIEVTASAAIARAHSAAWKPRPAPNFCSACQTAFWQDEGQTCRCALPRLVHAESQEIAA